MAKYTVDLKAFSKTVEQKILKNIDKQIQRSEKELYVKGAPLMKQEVDESIARGVSPVKGQGRFKDYSKSYKEQIRKGRFSKHQKRLRPVNLKLTGKMRKSLKARVTATGIVLFYSSPIAKYHNKLGAGKSKTIRRLLPVEQGEEFSRVITNKMIKFFNRILQRNIKG